MKIRSEEEPDELSGLGCFCITLQRFNPKRKIDMKEMTERKESSKEKKECKESRDRKKATTAAAVGAGAGAYAHEGDADVQAFINLFNGEMVEHNASIPTIYLLTPGYARMLRALIRDHSWEKVEEMVHRAAMSDFLNNHGRKPFRASVEWLLREENFIKVVNGNYDNTADGWTPRDPVAERRAREEQQRRYAREVEREEHERRMREREEWARGAVTYEEYQRMKNNGQLNPIDN